MIRTTSTALLLGLFAVFMCQSANAENAKDTAQVSKTGDAKQFGKIRVTFESATFEEAKADVVVRMDNLGDDEITIPMLLFFDPRSETGEIADYDFARSRCNGSLPPKGSFECKLALIFAKAPNLISLKVGEGMAGETVVFNIAR